MIWIQITLGLLLLTSLILNVLATWRGWLFHRRRSLPNPDQDKPPVTLMIPVCGVEGEGLAHFQKFCELDWPRYQVIFTVLDPEDGSLPILRQLVSNSKCTIDLQVGGVSVGVNLKVRNLLNAWPLVKHDWVVICDSDVVAAPDLLNGMLFPFQQDERIGLVHSLYRCLESPTLAAAWENVWINCDFWVQGLLGDWIKGTDFAFGAVMAVRRDTLESIGGFDGFKNHLADDYQLGNRVARSGKRLVFSSRVVTLQGGASTWKQVWKHLMRWSRTIRVCQPGGYAGSIIMNLTFWSLVAMGFHPLFIPVGCGLLVARMVMAGMCSNWIRERCGSPAGIWLVPLKDLAQVVLWAFAFRNAPIEWRGACYNLHRDGTLSLVSSK